MPRPAVAGLTDLSELDPVRRRGEALKVLQRLLIGGEAEVRTDAEPQHGFRGGDLGGEPGRAECRHGEGGEDAERAHGSFLRWHYGEGTGRPE